MVMASLKRILNPSDDAGDVFTSHQPPIPWDENDVWIDPSPIFPHQAWSGYVGDIVPDGVSENELMSCFSENDFVFQPIHPIQQPIEHWTAISNDDAPSSLHSGEHEQICFGMIFRVLVKLRGNMSELDRRLSIYGGHPYEGHVELDIAAMEEQYCVVFKDGEAMGDLNAQMDKALHSLAQEPISFEVLVNIRSVRETIEKAVNHKEAAVRVNINVYGPRRDARKIGQQLSTHKLYFQKPDDVRQGCVYDNPHVLKLADHQPTMQELPTLLTNQETAPEPNETEAFKKAVTLIFSSLRRGEKLTGLEGDKRLTTTLLQHQKEALDFMSQRENGPIPEEFVLWKPAIDNGHSGYRHAITSAFSRFSHQEVGGGILADDMGMGKTLSVLALVLQTLGAAEHWASGTSQQALELENTHGRSDNRRARTTLIIASSDLMINEWYHEMKEHIHEDTRRSLKRLKYHGQNRETDLDKLRDYDLIVTTYHTLASDLARGRDPLNQIEWYRLVLDEAHIIRRHSTKLYRTVAQLKARSRWCLTGTPIQNRLDDIGSLLTFLRIDPFHSMANFRRFITTPFETGGTYKKLAIDNLVRLLDSVNLRRTKDLLHLPEQRNRVRMLDFSDEERQQYEHTRQMIDRASRSQDNGFDQTTLGLFQMRLQLRILCNHGTFQQPFAWNRRKLHLLDAREAVENAIGEVGNVICSACQQPMPMWDDGSMYKRYTTCRHVLCSDCVDQSTLERQTGLEGSNNNFLSNCPLCTSLWSSMKRTVSSTESDSYFRNEGKSTKMKALMEDVRENISSTKSIIFTCWTRTLNLVQRHLNEALINFRRIDGECPTAKREEILEEFVQNPKLRVLIMTTGTGAVGLNLATANRVFIVEPQWNPSVENQAIARALRLGQESAVQVTRYVVNRTVEQEMRSLQDRKLEIAEFVWN